MKHNNICQWVGNLVYSKHSEIMKYLIKPTVLRSLLARSCNLEVFYSLKQKPAKAEGYPDNTRILYKTVSVADFITGDDYLQLLTSTNKMEFDKMSDVFAKHPLTTEEIRVSCEDIKVLGPGELKKLVKWREKLKKFLDTVNSDDENVPGDGVTAEGKGSGDAVLEKTEEKIKQLEIEEAAEVKR